MRFRLDALELRTRKSVERLEFSDVTFLHGPLGTGKSTVARLIDYCLGGDLERTPAIRREFLSASIYVSLGELSCTFERGAADVSQVRVSWMGPGDYLGSVNAPLVPSETPLVEGDVFNFSDLVFHLMGADPIKVRKRSREEDSPMVRLSIRDLWAFCYLDQTHLDSSFFRLGDPIRARKSQDAMRYFTGLHSEALNDLEVQLSEALDQQRSQRQAVVQIRQFMDRFKLGSELDIEGQIQAITRQLEHLRSRRDALQDKRTVELHPTDELRERLRRSGDVIGELEIALADAGVSLSEQRSLRAELLTAKTKALRIGRAGHVLERAEFERCPRCGTDIGGRSVEPDHCLLCGSPEGDAPMSQSPDDLEVMRLDLNARIDEISEAIKRRETALTRLKRQLAASKIEKKRLDLELQQELHRYDSAFVESVRAVDREIATMDERLASLNRLQEMPRALADLEESAGGLQGRIDRLRTAITEERKRLTKADKHIAEIARRFKDTMIAVGFPGVTEQDEVALNPRSWKPSVIHEDQSWDFWDAGSGGKKTLFNVCYALALHAVAEERSLPIPSILIIDSPTKNISEDENPRLVRALYDEIYRMASEYRNLQFLLIDSDLVPPETPIPGFSERRMAGESRAPSLIPYYEGP